MNKLIIKTYWNKVGDFKQVCGSNLREVLPEYELKSVTIYPDERNLKEFMKEMNERFSREIMETFDNGYKLKHYAAWGIKSYQIVTLE